MQNVELEVTHSNDMLPLEQAYEKYLEVKDSLHFFSREVHNYFFTNYAPKHRDSIIKAVEDVKAKVNNPLITEVIQPLAFKLPFVDMAYLGFTSDKDKAQARLDIATIIWHILMDQKLVAYTTKTSRENGVWKTLTTLEIDGDTSKSLLQGLHLKGGKYYQKRCEGKTITQPLKQMHKDLASIPFVLSDLATHDLIMRGYTMNKGWNDRVDSYGRAKAEHHTTKVDRYKSYADEIMKLSGTPFYLETKYSSSGRAYYLFQLEGLRPQGKQWETLLLDSAESYYLEPKDVTSLIHLIYCTVEGVRVTPEEAESKFNDSHLDHCKGLNPMEANDEDEFASMLLLTKASAALDSYMADEPTNYMFGWDFTTSGLIVAGMSFRSKEMMNGGNANTDYVVDAHTRFNDLLDLGMTRKDAKKVHQPFLHGGTLKGLLSIINKQRESDPLSIEKLESSLRGVYGDCMDNIIDIADWGTQYVSSEQSTVQWTLPDGFIATHKAYYESVEYKISVVSCDPAHKKGVTSHTIFTDLPYCEDNRGNPLVLPSRAKDGSMVKANLKVRGLYANITHSLDAYVLRKIVAAVRAKDMPILLKHDDFMVHPSCYGVVLKAAQDAFTELYDRNMYQDILDQLAFKCKKRIKPLSLISGSAENKIKTRNTFLMP